MVGIVAVGSATAAAEAMEAWVTEDFYFGCGEGSDFGGSGGKWVRGSSISVNSSGTKDTKCSGGSRNGSGLIRNIYYCHIIGDGRSGGGHGVGGCKGGISVKNNSHAIF